MLAAPLELAPRQGWGSDFELASEHEEAGDSWERWDEELGAIDSAWLSWLVFAQGGLAVLLKLRPDAALAWATTGLCLMVRARLHYSGASRSI